MSNLAKKKRTPEEMVVFWQKEVAHAEEGAVDARLGLTRSQEEEDAIAWHKAQITKANNRLMKAEVRVIRYQEELKMAKEKVEIKEELKMARQEYLEKKKAIKAGAR